MYLFTRSTRLAGGNGVAGVEWASSICSKVKEVSGQEVELWSTVYSPGFGTITWTAWFADLASLESVGDKLNADPGMTQLGDQGTTLTEGGLDDGLLQPLYGQPDLSVKAEYVGAAAAVTAAGNIERALAQGVAIAQKAEAITGLPTMFTRALTGPYGAVAWFTGYENVAAMEAAEKALAADSDWLSLIDSTQGSFVEDPSVSQQTIYRRLV